MGSQNKENAIQSRTRSGKTVFALLPQQALSDEAVLGSGYDQTKNSPVDLG